MPGLGNKLRIKRLAMGLSPRDAAKMAGIKQKYVWALEEEEILKFPDRDAVLESVKAYSGALGLEQAEMLGEFEKLWSDAGTAKIYMQQKYNRKGVFAIIGDNKSLGYGAAALAAVMVLSLGGYMVWGNYFGPGEPEDLFIAAPEESVIESVEEAGVIEEGNNNSEAGLQTGTEIEDEEEAKEEVPVLIGDSDVDAVPGYTPMTGGYSLSYLLSIFSFLIGFAFFLTSLTCKKTY